MLWIVVGAGAVVAGAGAIVVRYVLRGNQKTANDDRGASHPGGQQSRSSRSRADRDASDKRAVKEKLRSERLAKMLEEKTKLCETHKDIAAFRIAMTAVGVAVANADGVIAPSEKKQIDRFVAGVLGSAFPQVVKDQIAGLYADPPSFEDALRVHIAPVAEKPFFDWTLIEEMVEVVAGADGKLHDNERPLRSTLARFRANGGFDHGQG